MTGKTVKLPWGKATVEEEATVQHIVDLLESGINLFQAEALLGQFE